MERNMETHLLHLLVLLVWSTRAFTIDIDKCPSMPIDNLICYSDYNQNITCEWDSTTLLSDHRDARCTIYAALTEPKSFFYDGSCELEPVDTTNPARRKCTVIFEMTYIFQTLQRLSIRVTCEPGKEILSSIKDYAPACHVKLNPPGKPTINITTVSWLPYITKHKVRGHQSELQWKRQDQSWSNSTVVKEVGNSVKLEEKELIRGEMYEARVRVLTVDRFCKGVWSDWGPTATWRSAVGEAKPLSGVVVGVVHIVIGGVALFALVLTVLLLKNNKTPWVYMVKRIRGPPLPNPADSFLQNTWLSPHFTSDSFYSIKPVEILSVEVTSSVDFVVPCKREEKPLKKMDNYDSTNSSFSNPSYSELCTPPPPVSSLTPGNLEPCAADSPYGPVGSQSEERNAGQDDDKMRGRDMELFKLLLKSSSSSSSVISEPLQVDSDYKKTEQIQAERLRLQSLDSGMCSCEEVSQESMEVDSINVSDSHDEELEDEEQKERVNVQKLAFEKLFGVKGGMFGKESIPVCSGYEQVQNLQADSPELASLDSGVSSGTGERVSQEEITEGVDEPTESTRFLFPPPPSIALPCSLLPAPQLPLNVSSPGLSSALRPPLCHVLDRIAGMSSANLVEPSGDGYLPVRQEQC